MGLVATASPRHRRREIQRRATRTDAARHRSGRRRRTAGARRIRSESGVPTRGHARSCGQSLRRRLCRGDPRTVACEWRRRRPPSVGVRPTGGFEGAARRRRRAIADHRASCSRGFQFCGDRRTLEAHGRATGYARHAFVAHGGSSQPFDRRAETGGRGGGVARAWRRPLGSGRRSSGRDCRLATVGAHQRRGRLYDSGAGRHRVRRGAVRVPIYRARR